MTYYLAIDIGATSGRHIIGYYLKNELIIEEIYRFQTKIIKENDHFYWDIDDLFENVLKGLQVAKELKKIPSRIGIDTFGVDYVLLDADLEAIYPVYSYRDNRGYRVMQSLNSNEEMFFLTGVQPLGYNTIYQLLDDKRTGRLKNAKHFLMLSSYLTYLLTGVLNNEYSSLSTTGIIDTRTKRPVDKIMNMLNVKRDFLVKPIASGTLIGKFKDAIAKTVGYQAQVYASLQHDTASSFFGSNAKDDSILLSSGTWSLIGVNLIHPIINESAYRDGLSNELGIKNTIRFLKNITGMWLINELIKENTKHIDIKEAVLLAEANRHYDGTFNVNDQTLHSPKNLKQKIIKLLLASGYQEPGNDGELYFSVFHSLALLYNKTILDLEKITKKKYQTITVFGGGVKNELLNNLIEEITGLKVIKGPIESTALGNIMSIV